MAKIVAITGCPTGMAHTFMAAEALEKTAAVMGHSLKVETQGSEGAKTPLSAADIAAADVVIVASDIHVDMARFAGKPIVAVPVSAAIRKTRAVIESALAELGDAAATPEALVPVAAPALPVLPVAGAGAAKRLVGVTSCPTGIAHTFMAAEALKKSAAALGYEIRVETQGSVGAKNRADRGGDRARRRRGHRRRRLRGHGAVRRQAALPDLDQGGPARRRKAIDREALALPEPATVDRRRPGRLDRAAQGRSASQGGRTGPYKHLMTGVSYMLPLVVAGGLLIALAFAIGGIERRRQAGHARLGADEDRRRHGLPALSSRCSPPSSPTRSPTGRASPPGLIGGMLAMTLGRRLPRRDRRRIPGGLRHPVAERSHPACRRTSKV